MESFAELRAAVIARLSAERRLENCRVLGAFPPQARETPLRKPVIAVGFDALHLTGSLGGLLTAGQEHDLYGMPCVLTMRFDIFVPVPTAVETLGGYELLECLWESLLPGGNPFGFTEFASTPMVWDAVCEANRLTAKGKLHMALTRRSEDTPMRDIRLVAPGAV